MKTNKKDQSAGTDRRGFITRTLAAGAGLAMIAVGAERGDAQTSRGTNKSATEGKVTRQQKAGQVRSVSDRDGRPEHAP